MEIGSKNQSVSTSLGPNPAIQIETLGILRIFAMLMLISTQMTFLSVNWPFSKMNEWRFSQSELSQRHKQHRFWRVLGICK